MFKLPFMSQKKKDKEFQYSTLKFKWGGTQFHFGGYVLHWFSKVGCTEQIFSLKKLGSREQIFTRISMFGAEILPIG